MSKSSKSDYKRHKRSSSREESSKKKVKKSSEDSSRKKKSRRHRSSSKESWSSEDDARNTKKHRSRKEYDKSDDKKYKKDRNQSPRRSGVSKSKRNRFSDAPPPARVEVLSPAEIERRRLEAEEIKKKKLEEEQKKLLEASEEDRKKRRERVLAWRENIKKDIIDDGSENHAASAATAWTLEDDLDEEESKLAKLEAENKTIEEPKPPTPEPVAVEIAEDDEIDTLDAFMKDLKGAYGSSKIDETQEHSKNDLPSNVIQTVKEMSSKKEIGEIVEQNADAIEYTSEEEIEDIAAALANIKKPGKNLQAPDHSKIYYRDFKKEFYIEVPEISKMTNEEVEAYRKELESIQIRGKGCPKPFKKWVQIGVSLKIMEVLKRLHYDKPTPIQAQAIPAIMSGRDIIGIAKTGSGKTLAFLLPMLRHVMDQPPLEEGDGPIAIIMTPTRELALQIYKECKKFTAVLNLTPACIYGGSVISDQIADLKRGTEIIVCTPGRMIDMLAANSGKVTNCRRCTYLVLDEADRMFDMGFEPQVTKILEQIRPDRQITLFTATFSTNMEALARRILTKPIEIIVGSRNKVCNDIKQHLILIQEESKFFKLLELLGIYQEHGSILVFVEKQDSADELLADLFKKGYPCLSLHGGMDQFDRDSTINDFKNGVVTLMIATSVAARGLDVKNVILVINYDCPNHGEDYVHRCGRTGRAGNKGTAITFITRDDVKYLKELFTILEDSNCEVQPEIRIMHKKYLAALGSSADKKSNKLSGFSGKGFKFNDNEVQSQNEKRKCLKWSLGWQDSGDEAEEEQKVLTRIEDDIEKAFSSRPKRSMGQSGPVDKNKVDKAFSIANKLNEKITLSGTTTSNLSQLMSSSTVIKNDTSNINDTNMGLAKEIADKLNVRLNYTVMSNDQSEHSGTLMQGDIYFEEIDINDFPQQARWKITAKETLASVAEISECALTVKGQYVPHSQTGLESDRRLHLLIEATTEFKVQIAKAEIKRLLKEECVKNDVMFNSSSSSRYKIT